MKRIMKLLATFLIAIMFVSCGGEEKSTKKISGPITTRMEMGQMRIYAGDEPAEGWINRTVTLINGATVDVLKVYVENGYMFMGNFEQYSLDGEIEYSAIGKVDGNKWTGEIREYYGMINGKPKLTRILKGEFFRNELQHAVNSSLEDEIHYRHITRDSILLNGTVTEYDPDGSITNIYNVENRQW